MVYKFKEHGALKSGKPTFESVGMVTNWSRLVNIGGGFQTVGLLILTLGKSWANLDKEVTLLLSQFLDDLGKLGPQFPHLESIIVIHLLGC